LEGLGLNLSYLIVQIFNFLIIVAIMSAWAYKPVVKMLRTRREKIDQGLEDARFAGEARANAEKEAEEVASTAQQESTRIVREATERAEEVRREIREAAEAEAVEIRAAAQEDAEVEKVRILGELRGQVAALSIAAAQKIIGESLDSKRQHALIEEFFSGVKSGKVVTLEGENISGASAEVTSALPLTEEEQRIVRDDIVKELGDGATITFRVDPNILGGLVIRLGDKVLDGSVAGKLEGLRQSLH
jgi:F-type H+-transporting ATPase subunit b